MDKHGQENGTGEAQRLQKILAAAGVGSRRFCETLITDGRVSVNGRVAAELGAKAVPGVDAIAVDGRPVETGAARVTFLADKPRGVMCTSSDPEGRLTVVEWAARTEPGCRGVRLYSIGRLDYDSEGLILLTNDGALAQALAHPRHHVEKEYRAWLERPLTRREMDEVLDGVEVDGERLRALAVVPEKPAPGRAPSVRLVLGEGRNRHIRRMLGAVGVEVRRLRRIRIGRLLETDLRGREIRALNEREVARLLEEAGPKGRPARGAVRHQTDSRAAKGMGPSRRSSMESSG